jgi:hypothetical protein
MRSQQISVIDSMTSVESSIRADVLLNTPWASEERLGYADASRAGGLRMRAIVPFGERLERAP